MAEAASRALADKEFQKLWDESDMLIGKLLQMEAECEEEMKALAAGKARMRELIRLLKEKGALSKAKEEEYEALCEDLKPPPKYSDQFRGPSRVQ